MFISSTSLISIVVPTKNRASYINQFYNRLNSELSNKPCNYEIIFIDDGSNDYTIEILKNICKQNSRVKVIKFDKNYGQHNALFAGLHAAKGEALITIHDDMQENIIDIDRFISAINNGADIVCGWRFLRYGVSKPRKILSYLLNFYYSVLIKIRVHDIGCGLKAFKTNLFNNSNSHLDILRDFKMHRLKEIKIVSRENIKSTYSLFSLLRLFKNILILPKKNNYSKNLPFVITETFNL